MGVPPRDRAQRRELAAKVCSGGRGSCRAVVWLPPFGSAGASPSRTYFRSQLAALCTVPRGHTHPQNTRPRRTVATSVINASHGNDGSECAASHVPMATSGSRSKKSFSQGLGGAPSFTWTAWRRITKRHRHAVCTARRAHMTILALRFGLTPPRYPALQTRGCNPLSKTLRARAQGFRARAIGVTPPQFPEGPACGNSSGRAPLSLRRQPS